MIVRAGVLLLLGLLAGCTKDGSSGDVDADGDGSAGAADCDDSDPTVHHGATEKCDGIDQDCDGEIDEGVKTAWFQDGDGDGYGDPAKIVQACAAGGDLVGNGTDCDDTDGDIHPGADETCDGVDEDCDGTADDGAADSHKYFRDADKDGYGDVSTWEMACSQPDGWVTNYKDCDDGDADVYPDAPEVCDGKDDDCDGKVDDGAPGTATWYADADGDGYGDPAVSVVQCSVPAGYVGDATDCDDAVAEAHPGGVEVCDGADDDCDGTVDPAFVAETFDAAVTTWSVNGDAWQDTTSADGRLVLTDAAANEIGSAFYETVVPGEKWYAKATISSGGGGGGVGMAFAFLDETDPTLVGTASGLGIGGLTGWGVGLHDEASTITVFQAKDGVELASGKVSAIDDSLGHTVEVWFDHGSVTVAWDGAVVTSATLSSWPTEWLLGWSASTVPGGVDQHVVDDVGVSCP